MVPRAYCGSGSTSATTEPDADVTTHETIGSNHVALAEDNITPPSLVVLFMSALLLL